MKTYEIGAAVILVILLLGACTFPVPEVHGYWYYPILLVGLLALVRS